MFKAGWMGVFAVSVLVSMAPFSWAGGFLTGDECWGEGAVSIDSSSLTEEWILKLPMLEVSDLISSVEPESRPPFPFFRELDRLRRRNPLGLFGADSELFFSGRGELVGVLSFLGFSFGWGVGESVGDFLGDLDRPELRRPPDPRFRMLPKAAKGLDWVIPAFAKICVRWR